MIRKTWFIESLLFLSIWLGLMLVGRSSLLRDPGTFWHTVVGEQILQTGQLIDTDSFSFTCANQTWLSGHWLGECAMALAHAWSGFDTQLVLTVTLLAGLYGWCGARLLRREIHPWTVVFLVALTLCASSYHFHVRTHLATIVGMSVVLALMIDIEAGRIRAARAWWLVPLVVIWTNAHAGVLGGVGTIGLIACGWTAEWLLVRRQRRFTARQIIAINALAILCVLAMFCHPFGWRMIHVWFNLASSPVLPELMQEHRRMLATPERWFVLALAATYLTILAGTFPRRPRVTWLVPLVWLALSFSRIRHGPLFAATTILVLAELWPHCRWRAWLAQREWEFFQMGVILDKPTVRGFSWQPVFLAVSLLTASLICQREAVRIPIFGQGWAKLDARRWPTELVPDLNRYAKAGPQPIFNELGLGGFLIYYTPQYKIFIDDRCELYGDTRLHDYWTAMTSHPGRVDDWARQYDLRLALTVDGSTFDRYLQRSPGWRLVRHSPAANLYERQGKTAAKASRERPAVLPARSPVPVPPATTPSA